MAIPSVEKDPDAKLNYGWNWSAWLGTETIASSVWTVTAGPVLSGATFNATSTSVLMAGGVVGEVHTLSNRITTAPSGLIDELSITVTIVEH